jgi:aminoglycoside N3'-acetyltransferase
MAKRTAKELTEQLGKAGIEGSVVGVHSNLTSIGLVEPTPVSPAEAKRGLSPIAKTIINAFMDALGPKGTLFVPTHSLNFIQDGAPVNLKKDPQNGAVIDDGYYRPDTSPSLVGAFTQAIIWDDRAVRSGHPSHSTAAIGRDAEYLARGHTPPEQPVGVHNAFSKVIGLDGHVMFIGNTLKSNTTFHAYETLMTPDLSGHFTNTVAADWQGSKKDYPQTWAPNFHRDFYAEHKRRTRAFIAMRESGLLKEGVLGRGVLYYYKARDMARYFAEKVFPNEPDILFCNSPDTCTPDYECGKLVNILKSLYAKKDGTWDAEKIRSRMDKQFLEFLKPGEQRIAY